MIAIQEIILDQKSGETNDTSQQWCCLEEVLVSTDDYFLNLCLGCWSAHTSTVLLSANQKVAFGIAQQRSFQVPVKSFSWKIKEANV